MWFWLVVIVLFFIWLCLPQRTFWRFNAGCAAYALMVWVLHSLG